MLSSKLNLYNDEWLDVVFANRNKEYGAYELRKHHDRDTARALLITLVGITCAAFAYGASIKVKPIVADPIIETVVELSDIKTPPPPKKEEIKQPETKAAAPAPPQKTEIFTAMRPTDDPVVTEPPTIEKLETAVVSSVKSEGASGGTNADPNAGTGTGGTGTGSGPDNTVHGFESLEKMPEPVGGNEAWAKFLQKNIKYPQMAQSEGVSGKVFVSFIIEKDGQISNVTLLKGPGYGLDEEAMRVLRKAPAWKPGIQNGQPVRVRYTIPINFSMAE